MENANKSQPTNRPLDNVVLKAFGMCDGKPSAIPATHTVFTATLLLPSSGPGVVSFPPLTTTKTHSTTKTYSTTRSTSTTKSDRTPIRSSSHPTESSSTFRTSTRTSSVETSTSSSSRQSSGTPMGDADADGDSDAANDGKSGSEDAGGKKLNTAQVAGISVGVAAAAGFAAVAIFLARYYRRQRRLPQIRNIFSKRDTWPYTDKDLEESGSMAGVARQIKEPLNPSPTPDPQPPAYDRASWLPQSIGVAISGPRDQQSADPAPRRLSKLLPAKPEFPPLAGRRNTPPSLFNEATMVVPPQVKKQQEVYKPYSAPFRPRRQSPEYNMNATPARNYGMDPRFGSGAMTQIKPQPPAPAMSPAISLDKPQPPLPLPPKLKVSTNVAELAAPTRPAQVGRDSDLTEFEEDGGSSLSVHGQQIWVPPSAHPDSALAYYFSDPNGNWILRNPETEAQGSRAKTAADGQAAPTGTGAKASKTSLGPAVEIERADAGHWPRSSSLYSPNMPRPLFSSPRRPSSNRRSNPRNPTRNSADSGVTQFSAASSDILQDPPPGALSPVAESPPSAVPPGIYPGSQFGGRQMRNSRNLRLAPPKSARVYQPPGQPSPTLGLLHQMRSSVRGDGSARDPGSEQSTVRIVRPSPEPPSDRDLLPSFRSGQLTDPSSSSSFTAVSRPWLPPRLDQSPRSAQNSSQADYAPPHHQPRLQQQPVTQTSLPPSPATTMATTSTTSSSLLAKRLGPDRAADLAFPTVRPPSTQHRWRQQNPAAERDRTLLSPDPATPPSGVPITPTWVPRLTPTRRGDELFLNVQ